MRFLFKVEQIGRVILETIAPSCHHCGASETRIQNRSITLIVCYSSMAEKHGNQEGNATDENFNY